MAKKNTRFIRFDEFRDDIESTKIDARLTDRELVNILAGVLDGMMDDDEKRIFAANLRTRSFSFGRENQAKSQ